MKKTTRYSIKSAILSCALLLGACGQHIQDKENQTTQQTHREAQQQALHLQQIDNIKAQQAVAQSAIKQRKMAAKMSTLDAMPIALHEMNYPTTALIDASHENYTTYTNNPINLTAEHPVSTFSIDVDNASYSNIRRILNQGSLPPSNAVRVEEMVNYFSYQYPQPINTPFSVYKEVGPSPFNANKHLIHIGIQGEKITNSERPAANLVFLLDVSGSMNSANKLGLLKSALKMLSKQLSENDSVAIVVYAGAAGTVLEPTKGDNSAAINDALQRLSAGGSTNGSAGIELAYQLARQSFKNEGINRIILATDGDFNVGISDQQALKTKIEHERKSGISLTVLGFGRGNYNDALMQELAQNGNGNAFYIDTLNEARKVLVEELSSTLFTIAKDVKIQVEFNANLVSEYRLIGYESRALKREDFNNDKVDAGEIGAGHTVTAIYEITLTNSAQQSIDPLRYQTKNNAPKADKRFNDELAYLKLRYKLPQAKDSQLIEIAIKASEIKTSLQLTSNNYQFSAAVAGFAQWLNNENSLTSMDISNVITLAQNSKGEDKYGYRSEFINMVKLAEALK